MVCKSVGVLKGYLVSFGLVGLLCSISAGHGRPWAMGVCYSFINACAIGIFTG